jgi:hypothetical protein
MNVSLACRSHLVSALLADGWQTKDGVIWFHEGITGEYSLVEAIRILK